LTNYFVYDGIYQFEIEVNSNNTNRLSFAHLDYRTSNSLFQSNHTVNHIFSSGDPEFQLPKLVAAVVLCAFHCQVRRLW